MYRTFLKMGLRQEGLSKNAVGVVVMQLVLNFAIGGYLFWISRRLTENGAWTAASMWSLVSWLVLISALQQHMRASTTRQELEFIRGLPITSDQWLWMKMAQALFPIALGAIALFALPLGWAVGSGKLSDIPVLLAGFMAQYGTLVTVTYAFATYLSMDNDRSTRLFVARLSVVFAVLSVGLFALAAPKVAAIAHIVMRPVGYISGVHWFSLAIMSADLRWVNLGVGLLLSGFVGYLAIRMNRFMLTRVFAEFQGMVSVPSRTTSPMAGMLSKVSAPWMALVRKDAVTTARSWRQQIPGVISSAAFAFILFMANLKATESTSTADPVSAYTIACMLSAFVVVGPAIVPSLRAVPDDYGVLGTIRLHGNTRTFVWMKTLFATGYAWVITWPFMIMLAVSLKRLPISPVALIAVAVVSCFVTAAFGVAVTSWRLMTGVHPHRRDAIPAIVTYLAAQLFAVGAGMATGMFGAWGLVFTALLALVVCAGLLILAEEFLLRMDILA